MGENRVKIWVLIPLAVCLLRALSPAPKIKAPEKGAFIFGNRPNTDESRGWSREWERALCLTNLDFRLLVR